MSDIELQGKIKNFRYNPKKVLNDPDYPKWQKWDKFAKQLTSQLPPDEVYNDMFREVAKALGYQETVDKDEMLKYTIKKRDVFDPRRKLDNKY